MIPHKRHFPLFSQILSIRLSSQINEMKYSFFFIPVENLLLINRIYYFGYVFMNKSGMMDNVTITAKNGNGEDEK